LIQLVNTEAMGEGGDRKRKRGERREEGEEG
jgi:hypothetical protein